MPSKHQLNISLSPAQHKAWLDALAVSGLNKRDAGHDALFLFCKANGIDFPLNSSFGGDRQTMTGRLEPYQMADGWYMTLRIAQDVYQLRGEDAKFALEADSIQDEAWLQSYPVLLEAKKRNDAFAMQILREQGDEAVKVFLALHELD